MGFAVRGHIQSVNQIRYNMTASSTMYSVGEKTCCAKTSVRAPSLASRNAFEWQSLADADYRKPKINSNQ